MSLILEGQSLKRSIFAFILFIFSLSSAFAADIEKVSQAIYGVGDREKFSFHHPTYFIFGKRDLKLQFSLKYRVARIIPLYAAYTQLMFWSIYDKSKPFRDVNYNPELFYRLIENSNNALATLDAGYIHLSNGRDKDESRSLDRIFIRPNYFTRLGRHQVNLNLMVFKMYNVDDTNKDIVNHLGYWDLKTLFSDLIVTESFSTGLEFRTYAGSKVIDFDQGATQLGLIFYFKTINFNPSIYFQRFEGYSESLLTYDKRRTEYRLGLNLTF